MHWRPNTTERRHLLPQLLRARRFRFAPVSSATSKGRPSTQPHPRRPQHKRRRRRQFGVRSACSSINQGIRLYPCAHQPEVSSAFAHRTARIQQTNSLRGKLRHFLAIRPEFIKDVLESAVGATVKVRIRATAVRVFIHRGILELRLAERSMSGRAGAREFIASAPGDIHPPADQCDGESRGV